MSRVVALPGETIQSVGDTIVVDGRPLREAGWYDRRFGQIGSMPISSTTLRANRYFVLADNRANGCDSRTLGPIASSPSSAGGSPWSAGTVARFWRGCEDAAARPRAQRVRTGVPRLGCACAVAHGVAP